ncbi:acyltransferase family protein [Cryobacterium cryoconiti]|nr:acyltransferase [Cryobacterium cryoconiti]
MPLDGLRGIAALVVLIHHSLSLIPALSAAYTVKPVSSDDPIAWMMVHTPLHLLWAGPEAVYVFFIISGIVLTLPVVRRDRFDWAAYYPKRLIRLYVPVIAAVLLTMLLFLLLRPEAPQEASIWLKDRIVASSMSAFGVLQDFTLIFGVSGVLGVLWSLSYEVWFSLLLPAFVWGAKTRPHLQWVKLAVLAVAILGGALKHQGWLVYVPMFAVGALIATEMDRLQAIVIRISALSHSSLAYWGLCVVSLILLMSYWLVLPFSPGYLTANAMLPVVFAGAVLFVLLSAFWDKAARPLNSRVAQWLGLISFSLYLVHVPIIMLAAVLLGPTLSWLAIPLSIIGSLVMAWVFHLLVERPSHKLSQKVERLIQSRRVSNIDAPRRPRQPTEA